MTVRARNWFGSLCIGVTCAMLLAGCNGGPHQQTGQQQGQQPAVRVQLYPTPTAATGPDQSGGNATAPASPVPPASDTTSATAAPAQSTASQATHAQAAATATAPVASTAPQSATPVQNDPAAVQMDEALKKLDDSLSNTDTLPNEP